jgi:hypothetical protein
MCHKLKTKNRLLSQGQELYKYWINPQANPKVHKYIADQHSCKLSDYRSNTVLLMHVQVKICKFILNQGQ